MGQKIRKKDLLRYCTQNALTSVNITKEVDRISAKIDADNTDRIATTEELWTELKAYSKFAVSTDREMTKHITADKKVVAQQDNPMLAIRELYSELNYMRETIKTITLHQNALLGRIDIQDELVADIISTVKEPTQIMPVKRSVGRPKKEVANVE